MLRQLLETKSVRDFSCRLRTKNGAVRDVLLSVERLDFTGEAVILVIVHDMTERLEPGGPIAARAKNGGGGTIGGRRGARFQ